MAPRSWHTDGGSAQLDCCRGRAVQAAGCLLAHCDGVCTHGNRTRCCMFGCDPVADARPLRWTAGRATLRAPPARAGLRVRPLLLPPSPLFLCGRCAAPAGSGPPTALPGSSPPAGAVHPSGMASSCGAGWREEQAGQQRNAHPNSPALMPRATAQSVDLVRLQCDHAVCCQDCDDPAAARVSQIARW